MAPNDADIRPATYALDALIRETLARGDRRGNSTRADALLFLGNWHHAFPVVVVQDPILEPVDKLVWMVICQSGRGTGADSVFPSYADIARLANVSSTSTISRAIAILRATRWLSLCARSREANGRFGGNVYALHDEPLPLVDALHLDPGYMGFLQEAVNHHHARVRRIVAAVSATLDDDIRAGKDVLAPVNAMDRRIEAIHAIQRRGERRYFSFNAARLANLSNSGAPREPNGQSQYSKLDKPGTQNSKPALGSSKYINTTTTRLTDPRGSAHTAVSMDALIVPPRLKDNQRALAARYLAAIPAEHRQAVLDELAGRFQAERHGAKPVYDELRYLHQLCAQVNRGGFVPNLALKIQAERERRQRAVARVRDEAVERECKDEECKDEERKDEERKDEERKDEERKDEERKDEERAARSPRERPAREILKQLGRVASPRAKTSLTRKS